MSKTRVFVLGCFILIGVFDLVSGLIMAFSDEPWTLNGMTSAFTPLIQQGPAALIEALRGPYTRLAAFSVHVGVLTLFLAWKFRADAKAITALFVLYTIDGLGFAYYDHHFAAGTGYFYVKQAIGYVWVAALIAHIVEVRRLRKSAQS